MTDRRLYCDIDGVIYGWYDGCWQIRPYTRSFTTFVESHFKLYWTSFNSRRKQIRDAIGAGGHVCDGIQGHQFPGKLQWIHETGGIDGDWLMIEDTAPDQDQRKILEAKGIMWRWIVIPDYGADALLDVKQALQGYLIEGKIRVPDGWVRMDCREEGRSMGGTILYNGAKVHGRKRN